MFTVLSTTQLEEEYKKRNEDGSLITDFLPESLLPGGVLSKGIGCTVCRTVVEIISYEVKTVNASEEFIKKEIEMVCKLYPVKAAQDAVSTKFLINFCTF